MKIGIPRAFYYHSYPGLWESFFRNLGHEPVVSSPSTHKTLEAASAQTETENCLPQKLFDGHLLSLIGKVDAIFVPCIHSIVKKHNCCPRFGALLDATRAGIARGVSLVSLEINETESPLSKRMISMAQTNLGADKRTAKMAVREAFSAMKQHNQAAITGQEEQEGRHTYLLLGHPYTLHDQFIGVPIVRRLKELETRPELMTFSDDSIAASDIRWCVFNAMFQKLQTIDTQDYRGVIQVSTFNCGADSMMVERFRRLCKERNMPYMLLMVDEHTDRGGLDTRLEAFVDSLSWQQAK